MQFAVLAQFQRAICPQNGGDHGFLRFQPLMLLGLLSHFLNLAGVLFAGCELCIHVNASPCLRMQRHDSMIRSVNWCVRNRSLSGRRYGLTGPHNILKGCILWLIMFILIFLSCLSGNTSASN